MIDKDATEEQIAACEVFYPDNVAPAEHHDIILDRLQRVANGEIKNLIILAPPGSAKSTYASVVFPTWYMGAFPNQNIIMATYGSDLANKFGRKCRAVCKSKEFKSIFNTELTQGNTAANDWSLQNASTYMCGGIMSGMTGNRADGLIIDDPFKGREEADSETMRKKVKEEYKESLTTRLKPKGWQIIINTRWHEDDLCGDILPDKYAGDTGWITAKDGSKWYVLCLQAENQNLTDPLKRKVGEYLWPEWFPVEWWKQKKKTHAGRSWNALYQQIPSPEAGTYFNKQDFKRYKPSELPKALSVYGASDYAVTEGAGDFTEHGVAGFDVDENLWVMDWWSGQASTDKWIEEEIRLVKAYDNWPVNAWIAEGGIIRRAVEPFLKMMMRTNKYYFRTEWITSSQNKAANARGFQGLVSQGKVFVPLTPEGDALIDQLVSFPTGKFDDKVDVCGLFGRILDQTYSPRIIKPAVPKEKDAWGREIHDEEENWKIT